MAAVTFIIKAMLGLAIIAAMAAATAIAYGLSREALAPSPFHSEFEGLAIAGVVWLVWAGAQTLVLGIIIGLRTPEKPQTYYNKKKERWETPVEVPK